MAVQITKNSWCERGRSGSDLQLQIGELGRRRMLAQQALLLVLGLQALSASWAVSNVVTDWNAALATLVKDFNITNQISARYAAILSLAQHQALEAAYGGGEHASEGGVASEAENATAAYAAHFILSSYFPWRQYVFDALIKKQVGNYSADVKRGASALAIPLAASLIRSRADDNSQRWSPFTPAPPNGPPGAWQFTPNQTYALYPQLANTTTFVTPAPGKFANTLVGAAKPLAVGTSEYAKELADVASVGEKSSGDRSQYESETATFWAQPAGTSQLAAWLGVQLAALLPNNTSIRDTAKLFSQAGVAAYDGNINAWFLKYSVLFWRPITAIRQGSEGINAQPIWSPLLATPPYPEYPATHSVTCSAYFRTFQKFLGTDDVKLTLTSDAPGLAPRTYSKLSDAGKECAQSRVWGGVHFIAGATAGTAIGESTADYVLDNFGTLKVTA